MKIIKPLNKIVEIFLIQLIDTRASKTVRLILSL